MLEAGTRGGAAAVAALRACCIVGMRPPLELLKAENIRSLSTEDIVRMFSRLGETKTSADYSTALEALRSKVSDPNLTAQSLNTLSRQIANRLLKLAGTSIKKTSRLGTLTLRSRLRFTCATGKSAVGLAESLTKAGTAFWTGKRGAENAYRTTTLWLKALEAIVPGDSDLESIASVLRLWRNLRSLLPPSAHLRLASDDRTSAYIKSLRAQVPDRIEPALLDGRIDLLRQLLHLAESDPDLRTRILSGLRETGARRLLEMPAGVSEWLVTEVPHTRESPKTSPKPADESQSAAVESVAACLLSAWDAATDPVRAPDALKALRAVAHDLFKVDLIGEVGEIVKFDSRYHETPQGATDLDAARIVRPGVLWSNGLRSRAIIRALVEPQI
jgi:hypothetical protein